MRTHRRCCCRRRAAGLVWTGGLLLAALAALPWSGVPRLQAETLPEIDHRSRRDTTGQAALRWQVERPQRAASVVQADRVIHRIIGGEAVTYYYGNFYLDRDTVVVRADSAHVFNDRDIVRLFDNVRIRHHETLISSNWAEYRREMGEADLRGNVRVLDAGTQATALEGELREDMQLLRLIGDARLETPEYTISADTLVRDSRRERGEAFGNVRIVDPRANTVVTGERGLFAYDGSWAEVDRQPTLWTIEEGREPVHSVARLMRFFRYKDQAVMVDSVVITQGRMRAYADTAVSHGRDHVMLMGRPRLIDGDRTRMYGDFIDFFYQNGVLDRVILLGQARMEDTEPESLSALYRGLPEMDVLEGDSITVHFKEGEIHRADVVGQARSIYVPMDMRDEVAYNEVRGDTLVLRFQHERVREVEVRGNMVGTYHFARLPALSGLLPAAVDTSGRDTSSVVSVVPDTLDIEITESFQVEDVPVADALPDSLLGEDTSWTFDFAAHAEKVDYSGHSLFFDMLERTIAVSLDAKLDYGTMTLLARDIILDTESRELYADGDPKLEDDGIIVGRHMGYDFGHRTGSVQDGATSFDGYYYVGDQVNRYPDGSLKICSGRMTSCDHAEPHYHFWGHRMKMRLKDRVVAAPIVLKIGRVPIFALPFYFKSLKEGRRSGILFPNFNFGWSSREGRYVRNLGYYWATNDYTDFTFEIDYNERRELAWRVRNQYVKRYAFNGSLEFNTLRGLKANDGLREWQLRWRHDQPALFDDYRFRGDVEMASRTLSRSNLNLDRGRDIISGQLKSNIYLSRNFGFGGASLNASRTEYTNARDDDPATDKNIYTMILPSMSLSFKQLTLGRQLRAGQRGSLLGDLGRNTYFSQGYSLSNNQSETELTKTRRQAAGGNWGLTIRPPRISIFNVNVGANSTWNWTRTDRSGLRYDRADSSYSDIADITETSRPSLSFTGGVSTTLYGVIPAKVGPLQAIRHTLRLSSSVSYRPELGSNQVRSSSYGFSVGNRFDVKYLSGATADTARTVQKLDGLIDWNLNTSYNPDAQRQWSNISSGMAFKPGRSQNLSFRLNNTIDPYIWKVLNTQFNYSFGFSGRLDTGFKGREKKEERHALYDLLGEAGADTLAFEDSDLGDDFESDEDFDDWGGFYGGHFDALMAGGGRGSERDVTDGGRFLPWNLSGSVSLSHAAVTDRTTARASINGSARITRDWEFRYSASFDLETRSITRQEYRLQRDLHCWRLEFMRIVSTQDSEFGFRFYLKAIPELKLTRGKEDLLGSAAGFGGLF